MVHKKKFSIWNQYLTLLDKDPFGVLKKEKYKGGIWIWLSKDMFEYTTYFLFLELKNSIKIYIEYKNS